MPVSSTANHICHWDYVPGPMLDGRQVRTMLFICEYPYRTLRTTGPSEECEGCPVWDEDKKKSTATRQLGNRATG
jgi:hypothetical protein